MRTQLYINGQWVPGASTVPVTDPSDGSVIAEVAIADDAQCEAAIAAADSVAVEWAATAPRVRSEILRKAFEIMTAEIEEIATLISRENGKAMPDARGEAAYAAEFFRWFAEETVRTPGDFRMSPSGDKRILVTHQPNWFINFNYTLEFPSWNGNSQNRSSSCCRLHNDFETRNRDSANSDAHR